MESIKTIFTLKIKLVLLFLILALVPLAIIGLFSINTTEELIKNQVLRQLENTASDKAAILERWLDERKDDLRVIAGTSILKTMEPEVIAPYLDLIRNHYGVYKNITVISASKEVILSSHEPSPIIDLAHWDSHIPRESLFLSSIRYIPEEKESSFNIAAPVFDGNKFLGMVYGTVGTNKIIYIILRVALGKTGECYLVDKNGTFLAHKEPRRILTENISQSESFKNIFGRSDPRNTYLDYRGIEVLGTSRKVSGTDWYIVVEQDREEAFQSVEILKRYIYLTIFFALGSVFALTWIVSYHIVSPIRSLSRSAYTLALAEYDSIDTRSVKTGRKDEIGILFRAFENMVSKIRERQDNLEQRFNQKEAELKETDTTLKQFKLIAERSEKFAALGRMGAAIAHEIRTPLTSLKLFMESVQSDIEISPEDSEDFNIAMGQIKRIETAINRLLYFTKPKEPIFSEIDISLLIMDVVLMIRPLAKKQECVVETDIEDRLPSVQADKKLLEEAMINLFINSLEAMTGRGRIIVTASRDSFELEGISTPCIRIGIRDEGHGIPDAYMDLIFDPFFTTKSSGTGLGLPMVLDTINQHKGKIQVKSHRGDGTVFSIFIPVKTSGFEAYGKDTDN
ncbi:MAG: HAMP domain-containing protein [Deltaproteobacteria bacterium]|nr:HAMP domain-containing protein [Deltaproteobacteria bacterium]